MCSCEHRSGTEEAEAEAKTAKGTGGQEAADVSDLAKKPARSRAEQAAARKYAIEHGVERGGSKLRDAPPIGVQPVLHPDAEDEGLLVFVQSVQCRRTVWASAFDNDPESIGQSELWNVYWA